MTTTLAHPPAEDLGRFIEGTLDDAGRAAVVEHIADCDDCRIIVVDTTAFGEGAAAKPRVASGRWMAIAASLMLVVGAAVFVWNVSRDPLASLTASYARLQSRPVEARVSDLPYIPHVVTRGASENETSSETLQMEGAAGDVLLLRGEDAKTLHAKGVANLVIGNLNEAIAQLVKASAKDPRNARYWSDLSAAQLSNHDAAHALTSAQRAIALDPNLPEALFNRALAAEDLHSTDAVAAYRAYLARDSTSPWAIEAKQRIELLIPRQ